MAQTTYEVTLLPDGMFSVTVKSDGAEALSEALDWATAVSIRLAEQVMPLTENPQAWSSRFPT